MGIGTFNRLLTLAGRVLDRGSATEPFVHLPGQKPAFQGCRRDMLPRATPESQGVSSRKIADFLGALQADTSLNMHRVMILRHGCVITEASFGDCEGDMWRMTFSMSKSVVGLAIGLLCDEGLLSVHDRVTDFFQEELNVLVKRKWRELTVEDLLTMRSGATFSEAESMCEEDWVKGFSSSPVQGAIGERFRYNSLNTYMLAAVIRKVTGQGVTEFLRARLFDPMGIGEVYWETCPRGTEKGGWGLYIHPEDMAKLGLLFLGRGMWQGKRLVSEKWIAAMIAPRIDVPESYGDYRYGYQVWTARDDSRFLFNGMLGQNVMGFWQNDILLVSCAGNDEMFQQSRYFELAHRTFSDAFPKSLPPDAAGMRKLADVAASLRAAYPARPEPRFLDRLLGRMPLPLPPLCQELDGTAFSAASPAASVGLMPLSLQVVTGRFTAGLVDVAFEVEGDRLILEYSEQNRRHRLPIGFYEAARTTLTFGDDRYIVAARGRCARDEDDRPVLVVDVTFLETPFSRRLKFVVGGDTLLLKQSEQPGERFVWLLLEGMLADVERTQPLVGGALQKIDLDYLHYKTERQFWPRVELKKSEKSIKNSP